MTRLRCLVSMAATCGLVALVTPACESESGIIQPCPEGTVRAASGCIGDAGAEDTLELDASTTPDTTPAPDVAADGGDLPDTPPTPDTTEPQDTTPVDDAEADGVEEDAGPLLPTALPFTVDDYYAPSGFMGDGETPGGITLVDNACDGARAGDGLGFCREFTWTKGSVGWGGVFWQYPDGNWGSAPGLPVPEGASEVTFYAWGATGNEVVNFLVGIGDVDGFAAESGPTSLGTEPAEYRISLEGRTIGAEVVGGFGWVTDTGDTATFTVDNIQWR